METDTLNTEPNIDARVLVVEDEELIRTMIKFNLDKAGYRVSAYQDAESMLKEVDDLTFNLVMLDINLPGMSGEDALKELRKRGINAPVIMVTAKNDLDTKVNTFDLGADDYIAKPFDMQELLARVKAMIRRSRN